MVIGGRPGSCGYCLISYGNMPSLPPLSLSFLPPSLPPSLPLPPSVVVDVIPSVIEPSFGVGRILYAILEHAFGVREGDDQRAWLALSPIVAPISCSVLPLSGNEQFTEFVHRIGMYVSIVTCT